MRVAILTAEDAAVAAIDSADAVIDSFVMEEGDLECGHTHAEACTRCCICGECREDLDDEDICPDCDSEA